MADKLAAYFGMEVRQRNSSSLLKDHPRRRGV
jgi:hypothetical protein